MSDWSSFIELHTSINENMQTEANAGIEEPLCNNFALVSDDVIVEVAGPDAEKLLQGQVTADVAALTQGQFAGGALCTNKGRIIATFKITPSETGFLCRLSADSAEAFITTLKKYGVFYKVEIKARRDMGIFALFGAELADLTQDFSMACKHTESLTEVWLEQNAWGNFVSTLSAAATEVQNSAWLLAKIRMYWPDIKTQTAESFLPHALSLDLAEAISFTKGCYTGQEIVARTHYRGKSKKRLVHLVLAGETQDILLPGTGLLTPQLTNLGSLVVAAKTGPRSMEILASASIDMPSEGELVIEGATYGYRSESPPWVQE